MQLLVANYGDFLRDLRRRKGLTQTDITEELVARGQRKYAQTSVARWETNDVMHPTDPEFLRALADILGVTEADLLAAMGHDIPASHADELPPEARDILDRLTPDQLEMMVKAAQLAASTKRKRGQ